MNTGPDPAVPNCRGNLSSACFRPRIARLGSVSGSTAAALGGEPPSLLCALPRGPEGCRGPTPGARWGCFLEPSQRGPGACLDDTRQAAPCSAPGHLLVSGVSFEALVWGRQGGALSAWRGRASQWRARKWTGALSSGFEGVLAWGATGMLEGPWRGFVGGSVSCSVVCGRGLGGCAGWPSEGTESGRQTSLSNLQA